MSLPAGFLPERVADFYGQNQRAILINAALLALALWALSGRVPSGMLAGWSATVLASHALRLGCAALRHRDTQADAHALRWAWAASAALGCTGLAWGGGAWIMLRADDPTAEVFWTIALCGIAAGVVAGAPYFVPAQWAYLWPLLLPLVLHYGLQPSAVSQAVAGGLALFLVFCLAQGRAQARSLLESLAIRAENLQLMADLQARTQEALAAQQLAEDAALAKARFFAAASHDLRQPMQALVLLDAALADVPPTGQGRLRQQMSDAIAGLDRLFEGVLTVARLDASAEVGTLQPVALAPLARRLVQRHAPLAETRGLHLTWRQAPGSHVVWADPAALERLLANLLANALQHTPQGRVLLALRHGDGGTLRLQVRDNGVGIASAHHDRIFDEFYQVAPPGARRGDGSGLGLAIARRLAQAMGGQITLRSQPGQGSCFTVRLPAATMGRPSQPQFDTPTEDTP